MLNGIDPILIFQFAKLNPTEAAAVAKIPVISSIVNTIGLPPIPVYLSEKLTGLYIDSEDKNIDIETTPETLESGATPIYSQKAINSTVKINLIASSDSIGLTLLSALMDLIVPKVTSREYSITYLHGAVTVFNGLLHSYSVTQNAANNLYNISLEIAKTAEAKKSEKGPTEITKVSGTAPIDAASASTPPLKIVSPPISTPPASSAPAPISIGGQS